MPVLTDVKYEGNDGVVYNLKISPDYAVAAGTEPVGGVNTDIKPKISKTNREHGIRPRGVRLVRTVGTAPDTFKKYAFLPVLTVVEWASGAYGPGAAISIGTTAYTVSSRLDEDY